jgi:hypothetical protein
MKTALAAAETIEEWAQLLPRKAILIDEFDVWWTVEIPDAAPLCSTESGRGAHLGASVLVGVKRAMLQDGTGLPLPFRGL